MEARPDTSMRRLWERRRGLVTQLKTKKKLFLLVKRNIQNSIKVIYICLITAQILQSGYDEPNMIHPSSITLNQVPVPTLLGTRVVCMRFLKRPMLGSMSSGLITSSSSLKLMLYLHEN